MIVAIDPGTQDSAYLVWHDGRILKSGKEANALVLASVREWALGAGAELVIEMIASYGMPVGKEVFETCVWIGRFMEAWAQHGKATKLVTRIAVKTHLCHSAKAKDGNVRQALIDRFGEPGKKTAPGPTYGITADIWSALAVAAWAMDHAEGA